MNFRRLGKTGFEVSEVSLGTWQVGGKWGSNFDHSKAARILDEAIDLGVNFIDTADVYEAGLSEEAVGKAIKRHNKRIYVATKCGRQINPHTSENYTIDVLRKYVEDSLRRLGLECIDLIQLHCPPWEVYYRPEIFGLFERLKEEGKILNLGVSIEKVEQGIKALEYPNVTSIQVIFNMFRLRPAERLLPLANRKDVGIIVRVPLASGMLTGTYTKDTVFEEGDHRFFNREGAGFDKGETFSGINYEKGLAAVDELKELFPGHSNLAALAIKWVLMNEHVSTVIPGASRPDQVPLNLAASDLPEISLKQMEAIESIYVNHIKKDVHQLW